MNGALAAAPLEAGFTAKLAGELPVLPVATGRRDGKLSQKQSRGFLGEAAKRVAHEAKHRGRVFLKALDRNHKSGCRTKQQRWDALAAIAPTLLSCYDIATGILGWLDADGEMRLNRQRLLAEKSGMTDCRVSRTLGALEQAGYIRRKFRRLFKDGKRWITRVMIHLRPRFFIDLGLGHLLASAKNKAKAKRAKTINGVQQRRLVIAGAELAKQARRTEQRHRARAKQQRAQVQFEQQLQESQVRTEAHLIAELMANNPNLTPAQIRALLARDKDPA